MEKDSPLRPCKQIEDRIRDKHPDVDPVEFHEFVKNAIGVIYAESPVLGKAQVPRVIELTIEAEEQHFFDQRIEEFKDNRQRRSEIADTIKIKEIVPIKPKALQVREIDRPIQAGGLTPLHVAAQAGDFKETRRLIERECAKIDVRDNSGQRPIDLALAMGYVEIAAYLEERLTGAKERV